MTTVYLVFAGLVIFAPTPDLQSVTILLPQHADHSPRLCWDQDLTLCLAHTSTEYLSLAGSDLTISVASKPPKGSGKIGEVIKDGSKAAKHSNSHHFGWIAPVSRFYEAEEADLGTLASKWVQPKPPAGLAARLQLDGGKIENCLMARTGRSPSPLLFYLDGKNPLPGEWTFSELSVAKLEFEDPRKKIDITFADLGSNGTIKKSLSTEDCDHGSGKCLTLFLSNLSEPQCAVFPSAEVLHFSHYYDYSKRRPGEEDERRPVAKKWFKNLPQPPCMPSARDDSLRDFLSYIQKSEPEQCPKTVVKRRNRIVTLVGVQNRPICLMATLLQE